MAQAPRKRTKATPAATRPPLTEADAVALATNGIRGLVDLPPNVTPVVEMRPDQITVTFPTTLEPGVRGADFHARVTIDPKTGTVSQILGGH